MTRKFIYFDLGKVLLDFDVEVMCGQVAAAAGINVARVKEIVFGSGLQERYESGQVSSREFYETFCAQAGTRPDYDVLERAGSDIFTPNYSMLPIVAQLAQAGYRLGILSNTCESHWEHCLARYRILQESFSVYALSYRIQASKPNPEIFLAAAEMAGCRPEDIFYTDDIAGHIAGARAVGFDAVVYTSTPQLAAELRARKLRFNY